MKAFTKTRYGGPEILELEEVPKPVLKDKHILVKIKANSANASDWHVLRGDPFFARLSLGLFKPKDKILGSDFSGIVEAVGKKVSNFKVGDRVFGESITGGAFAEFISIDAAFCAVMPKEASFTEMACMPIAGLTALQALTTHGKLKAGESTLINGASGGVGHFTVQIAKAIGANVTAVCSSRNTDFVKNLGADKVIAYDEENIHEHTVQYDIVIDNHGNLAHEDYQRIGHRGVIVGFTTMGNLMTLMLKRAFSKFPLAQFTAQANTKDLETLANLVEDKKVKPQIEKTYSYEETPRAIAYIESMHTRGKVAMSWDV